MLTYIHRAGVFATTQLKVKTTQGHCYRFIPATQQNTSRDTCAVSLEVSVVAYGAQWPSQVLVMHKKYFPLFHLIVSFSFKSVARNKHIVTKYRRISISAISSSNFPLYCKHAIRSLEGYSSTHLHCILVLESRSRRNNRTDRANKTDADGIPLRLHHNSNRLLCTQTDMNLQIYRNTAHS